MCGVNMGCMYVCVHMSMYLFDIHECLHVFIFIFVCYSLCMYCMCIYECKYVSVWHSFVPIFIHVYVSIIYSWVPVCIYLCVSLSLCMYCICAFFFPICNCLIFISYLYVFIDLSLSLSLAVALSMRVYVCVEQHCVALLQCVAVFRSVLQCAAVCCVCKATQCYGVATISRLLKIIGLFCRTCSLL